MVAHGCNSFTFNFILGLTSTVDLLPFSFWFCQSREGIDLFICCGRAYSTPVVEIIFALAVSSWCVENVYVGGKRRPLDLGSLFSRDRLAARLFLYST